MNVLIPILILCGLLYSIFLQIDAYNHLQITKIKFKLYSLRDRLALMVCKGELKEKSWEYEYIIDALNFHIQVVETISINEMTEVMDALQHYHTSKKETQALERFESQSHSEKINSILFEYMATVQNLVERNSYWQLMVFRVLRKIRAWRHIPWSEKIRTNTIAGPAATIRAIQSHQELIRHKDFVANT